MMKIVQTNKDLPEKTANIEIITDNGNVKFLKLIGKDKDTIIAITLLLLKLAADELGYDKESAIRLAKYALELGDKKIAYANKKIEVKEIKLDEKDAKIFEDFIEKITDESEDK